MTLRQDSRVRGRTRTRAAIPTARRLSPCYRHPDEPLTGICPSCLRERLSGLDLSDNVASSSSSSSELRRCSSVVSIPKFDASFSGFVEPRRKSCDVVSAQSSLSTLLNVDDVKSGSGKLEKVESKNLGISRVSCTVIESKNRNRDDIGVSRKKVGEFNVDCVDSDGEAEEGEFKTMKEYIDLEFENKVKKSKDLRNMAGNFWKAASIFSKKLRKWGQKNNKTKQLNNGNDDDKSSVGGDGNLRLFEDRPKLGGNQSDIVGRRSCDTEPRFSVDGGRISFEEPRASWDGYMIARTIPRLAPMFSVVENGILGDYNRSENHRLSVDGPMNAILEDESSSAASGSGHSNSDSSSSMRLSSFDRSSSVVSFGNKVISSEDNGASPANVKLVITEKELKDWRLSSSRGDAMEKFGSFPRDGAAIAVGNSDALPQKSVRWRSIRNVFSFRTRNSENKTGNFPGNVIDTFTDEANEKQVKESGIKLKGGNDWKFTRSSSVVGLRNSCDAIGSNYRRRSVDGAGGFVFKRKEEYIPDPEYSSTDLEDGIKPFYMTPLRSLRHSKSGKFKLQNPHAIVGNVLQLN